MKTFLIIWTSIGAISYICIIMALLRTKFKGSIMRITQNRLSFLIGLTVSAVFGMFMSGAIFYEVRYRMRGVDWPKDLFNDR